VRSGSAIYFNARNLPGAPLRYDEDRPIQREFCDVTYQAGGRFRR